ncbi:hypothetical protein HOB30_01605 [Candidatus Falkowbacteria bacterium]|jgi:hypothetical protein|nr:hypothetical protein [Candidatus Falkowbacteria bacterium]
MRSICGFPGCNCLTAREQINISRKIDGVPVCQACYQRTWRLSKTTGVPMNIFLKFGIWSQTALPKIRIKCSCPGCTMLLLEDDDATIRRTIGIYYVCRKCYQRVWAEAKQLKLSVLDTLFQYRRRK